MYAIIEDSGTQIKVKQGDVLDIDLRDLKDDQKSLKFDRVLAVGGSGKGAATIGRPYVTGATVAADVVGPVIGDKLTTVKYKRRKGFKVKKGHRQGYLRVKITGISA